MAPIRVLLVDDHSLLRAGLRGLLEKFEGVKVVGEASNGRVAFELVGSLLPDVVITDIGMPVLDGLALTALVTRDFPTTRVMILSMHTEKEYVDKALRAGAAAYLIKDAGTSELELAIRAVARGGAFLSPGVSMQVIANYARMAEEEHAASNPLSPRQREVLKLIAEGLPTKAIAHRLDISIKTAETHRTLLMERLRIHDAAGLVGYAIRIGLVDSNA